jgi:hypothetical protein
MKHLLYIILVFSLIGFQLNASEYLKDLSPEELTEYQKSDAEVQKTLSDMNEEERKPLAFDEYNKAANGQLPKWTWFDSIKSYFGR